MMSDLLNHVERTKLAHQLAIPADELDGLSGLSPDDLAHLRGLVTHAMFSNHEHRFTRMASAGKLVPPTVAAKGAQVALGPLIAARVAAVTDPRLANKLAGHLPVKFLADMAPHIDPTKVAGIVRDLPERLLIDTGKELIARGEHMTLGAFVTCAPTATAVKVVDHAAPLDLLHVAVYADDREALDAIIAAIDARHLRTVLVAADESGLVDDALALLALISLQSRTRVVRIAAGLDAPQRDRLVEAIHRNDAWGPLVPVLEELTDDEVVHLLDVPCVQRDDVRGRLLEAVAGHPRAAGLAERLTQAPH